MSQRRNPGKPKEPLRRGLLSAGLAGGAGLLASKAWGKPLEVPPWTKELGRPVGDRPYGRPSEYERHVVRRQLSWMARVPETAVNFTPLQHQTGILTASGVHFERHHGGIPKVDPEQHRLVIHGLVERPLTFTMEELARFPSVSRIHFIECAANGGLEWKGVQLETAQHTHGMLSCSEWTGVKLSTLLGEVGLKPEAKWLLAEGADAAAMTRSIPLDKALDDCILAWGQNGEALRPEQGYPLRLVAPGWEGNLQIKWLRRIEVGEKPWHTREETARYSDFMPDGTARQFTFVQEANSVILRPSGGMRIPSKGFYEISGLAWSGRGKVKEVHVSLDGGDNWQVAQLQDPVLPQSLTRFTLPWWFEGKRALLQSRCVDETGYVQPKLEQLIEARGVNSFYHKNAIQTWEVNGEGEVKNVHL